MDGMLLGIYIQQASSQLKFHFIQYQPLTGTTSDGLVDVPITNVTVLYTDPNNTDIFLNACANTSGEDEICTCGDVDGSDTSCSLYLPLTQSLSDTDDMSMISVVLNVSNEGINNGLFNTQSKRKFQCEFLCSAPKQNAVMIFMYHIM